MPEIVQVLLSAGLPVEPTPLLKMVLRTDMRSQDAVSQSVSSIAQNVFAVRDLEIVLRSGKLEHRAVWLTSLGS
jgi:hypothetical protein